MKRRSAHARRVTVFLGLLSGLALCGAECVSPASTAHPEALVVYNTNHPDAGPIASYYAEQRGIDPAQLCPVELPVGQFASKDQLLAARQTILEDCVCGLIPPPQRPEPCAVSNVDAVRAQSKITHLVFVKGIPPRLYGTPWPSDFEEPSFDFYLAHLVYRNQDIFAPGTNGVPSTTYLTPDLIDQSSSLWILSAPPLDPAIHEDVAYGRIEAMDLNRTLALIDRTLDAEQQGITGSFLEEKDNKNFRFLQDLTGSHTPECTSYITWEPFLFDTPESSWPHASCRAGTTTVTADGPDPSSTSDDPVSRVVPGSFMSTIPRAVGVGLMLGSTPGPNAQAGFNSFDVLANWRKSGDPCEPLCADLPTQAERDACVAQSTDWFRELNTECVGAARGFIGHQVRSYPVQYYGFFPAGWQTHLNGDVEKTAPRILTGGAFQDARFVDDFYLHVGESAVADPDANLCQRVDGAVEPCPERIAVSLRKPAGLVAPLPVGATKEFLLRLRHRNVANPAGQIHATLAFLDDAIASVSKTESIPLDQASPTWTTSELVFAIEPSELPQITQINVEFTAGLADQLYCCLDLDGLELVELETGNQILDVEGGSFDVPLQDQTHPGDYAANAIDRLGGIAWWGSSSHHLIGGWGLSRNERFYGAFFMGRTLGESLLLTTGGESAIIYGDPLYRPVAVRIHLPGVDDYGEAPGLAVDSSDLASLGRFYLNAFHGSVKATRWSLASCPVHDRAQCDAESLWTERLAASEPVLDLPVDWTSFVDLGVAQDLLLRLQVWNPGEESDELFSYAYLQYTP